MGPGVTCRNVDSADKAGQTGLSRAEPGKFGMHVLPIQTFTEDALFSPFFRSEIGPAVSLMDFGRLLKTAWSMDMDRD